MIRYDKLVRDRIPAVAEAAGKTPATNRMVVIPAIKAMQERFFAEGRSSGWYYIPFKGIAGQEIILQEVYHDRS